MKLHTRNIVGLGDELGRTLTASRATLANVEESLMRLREGATGVEVSPVSDAQWGQVTRLAGEWLHETTAQRFYGNEAPVIVGDKKVYWLDMEIPTERYGGRIDLLGAVEESDEVRVFAELKYSPNTDSSGGGSPVSALLQALRYVANAADQGEAIQKVKGHTDRPNASLRKTLFPAGWSPCILVAANESYWKFWEDKLGDHFSKLGELGSAVADLLRQAHPHGPTPWVRWAKFDDLPPENEQHKCLPTGSKKHKFSVPEAEGEALCWRSLF